MTELAFKDVFGVDFGDRKNVTTYPDRSSSKIDIVFTTPSNSEDDVRFSISTMAFVMDKNIRLMIIHAGHTLYEDNRSLSMFVNKTGIDPKAGRPTGNPDWDRKIRDTHLLPNTEYTFRLWREHHKPNNPLSVTYAGLVTKDEVEYGTPMKNEEGEDGMWFPLEN